MAVTCLCRGKPKPWGFDAGDELRPGNMPFFEIGTCRNGLIGRLRVRNEDGRAIEDAQIGIAELALQRAGVDQKLGVGKTFRYAHDDLPIYRCWGSEAAMGGRWGWNSVACSKAWPTRITPASSKGLPAI